MKPLEKKPEEVFRIIERTTGEAVGSYSRAYCDEYDFRSASEARNANCHGIFQYKAKYAIAKYRVTYELIAFVPQRKEIKMTCEEFYQTSDQIRSADPEEACTIDSLCCTWLEQYCGEMGQNGQTAKKLLAVVKELLEIQ